MVNTILMQTSSLVRWRSRKNTLIVLVVAVVLIFYYICRHCDFGGPYLDLKNRNSVIEYIERRLEQGLKQDKGLGCEIPKLDPFAIEVTQFDVKMPKVVCPGQDWVRCNYSKCSVIPEILNTTEFVMCQYRDILYESDSKHALNTPVYVYGPNIYELKLSDHVEVKCTGRYVESKLKARWQGYSLGFRSSVSPKPSSGGDQRGGPINVLIIGFDSTSKNGFIRRMPRSYKVLTESVGAIVLNGYNILGDGTPAALIPLLTGHTELELPDARKGLKTTVTFDPSVLIFDKVKKLGYRTAFFEDSPWIGTFQYRFNGFSRQPADHYLQAVLLEETQNGRKWWYEDKRYCVGDTPQYKLMLNITDQFFNMNGKKFCFTFMVDISHDDFNMITTADDDFAQFLLDFQDQLENTLLIVMGDHGSRFSKLRGTYQGQLEERLPLMSIRLPNHIVRNNPQLQDHVRRNADVLTTPHDIYHTVLDVLGLRNFWNPYRVKGADLTRGLSLLAPIPKNRSCSEAGIEPHWCSCLNWETVSTRNRQYTKTADALVDFINSLTATVRSKCLTRTLSSIFWVKRKQPNAGVLKYKMPLDIDGYVGEFGKEVTPLKEYYQVKLTVGPGIAAYEATMVYLPKENKFEIDTRDISRTNPYGNEPRCISETLPSLNMYCYCKE